MVAGVVDHLWQSAWMCGAIGLLALISRDDFAPLRLWLWRIAALKFAFPFALLVAAGGWLGFHVRFPDDPAPAGMLATFRMLASLASPARVHGWNGWWLSLALLVALLITCACVWWLSRQLHVEQQLVMEESRRIERDINDLAPRPGFFNSALLTACAMAFVAVPVLAGGLEDRQRRYELLVVNAQSLRDAAVTMKPAVPGMGRRFRIDADSRGVFIRNVTIQELAGIAYGATRYYVRGDHWQNEGEEDWFIVPRYDVQVSGRIVEPEAFDPYALRARITRMLAERHGLEIYVDSKCQPPCGKYAVPMPADPL
jgi:hypothetical protein